MAIVPRKKPASSQTNMAIVPRKKPASSDVASKKAKTEADVLIKLIMMSGEPLAEIRATTAWTIAQVKAAGNSYLQPGKIVQSITINGRGRLNDAEVLSALAPSAQIDVQVVIGGVPTLHVFKPCSVFALGCKLTKDSDAWNGLVEKSGSKQCYGMADAPLDARTVAGKLAKAAPNLDKINVLISHGGLSYKGEIVVIANPGTDAKSACFTALGVESLRIFGESVEKLTQVNKTVQHSLTKTGLTVFNGPKSDEEEEDDYTEDEDEKKMLSNPQLNKLQKLMSETLRDLFVFEFVDRMPFAPILFGGYASDGSIVGVLSSRFCSQS